mmetsp:Transcript_12411/g.31743  ORF Transcript_12411/g.31743 Transcript_12411/m.31743 type:complete len:303 (+) Transcript_12411:323-1231(+)
MGSGQGKAICKCSSGSACQAQELGDEEAVRLRRSVRSGCTTQKPGSICGVQRLRKSLRPSWPSSPRPHRNSRPAESTAPLWSLPLDTLTMERPVSARTVSNLSRGSVSPSPSCPYTLAPAVLTTSRPFMATRASVCALPAVTCTTRQLQDRCRPPTRSTPSPSAALVGTQRLLESPRPRHPLLLRPNMSSAPPTVSAMLWLLPDAMAVTRLGGLRCSGSRSATFSGSGLATGSPSATSAAAFMRLWPSWPYWPFPQVKRLPSLASAMLCAAPAAALTMRQPTSVSTRCRGPSSWKVPCPSCP